MEKSLAKKGFTPARIVPFALVLVGLVCASWLSINNESESANFISDETHDAAASDTSITSHSYRGADRIDDESEQSAPQVFAFDYAGDISIFPPPDPATAWAPFPALPGFPADSIPGFLYVPDGDWGKFEKEFTEKFHDEFGEFFEKNREQFEKMMNELRKEHDEFGHLSHPRMYNLNEEELKALEEQMSQLSPIIENWENMMPQITGDALLLQEEALRMSEEAMAHSDLAHTHADIARMQEQMMRDQERMMLDQERNLRAYEEELIDQLRTDGYLGKDEKVNDINIRNGEVTVNGKKVKEKDQSKYREIIDRFNAGWHTPRRPE